MTNNLTAPHKAVCFTLWFSTHNNVRYTDLFPKLNPIVRFYKITLSRHRVLRGLQYRLWNSLAQQLIYPGVLRYLGQRYETLLTVDIHQIPAWPRSNSVVIDVDDPIFSPTEIRLLNLPQVKAIIVTTERAKAIFERLGVARPIYVIPQGVAMERIDPHKVRQVRAQFKGDRDVVIGYHAPTLTLSSDGPQRARQGLDDLDFLFAAMKQVRKDEPRIKLWLLGELSKSVKKYIAEEPWIMPFGYIPFSEILNYISNYDIGVYPRVQVLSAGWFRVKIAQYMACGIPTISTNIEDNFILKEGCCGVICDSQEDFSRALMELVRSTEKRAQLGRAGRMYVEANLDWSMLVGRYRSILME